MKKITALVLLSILPSFIFSMESQRSMSSQTETKSQGISPEAQEKIVWALSWPRTNAKIITPSPDGTKIAVLTGDGDVELFNGEGENLGRIAAGKKDAVALNFNKDGTQIFITGPMGREVDFSTYRVYLPYTGHPALRPFTAFNEYPI